MPIITGQWISFENGTFEAPAALVDGDNYISPASVEVTEIQGLTFFEGTKALRVKTNPFSTSNPGEQKALLLISPGVNMRLDPYRLKGRINATIINRTAGDGDIKIYVQFGSGSVEEIIIPEANEGGWVILDVPFDNNSGGTGSLFNFFVNTTDFLNENGLANRQVEMFLDSLELEWEVTTFYIESVVTNVSSAGGNNGAINLSIVNGSGDFSYAWADGPVTQDRTGLIAGTYNVTVTDNITLEEETVPITVNEPTTDFDVDFAVINAGCFGTNTGAVTTSVSGSSGYTFLWSDGSTAQNRLNMYAGTYTVAITDFTGFSKTYQVNIGENSQIKITANVQINDVTITVTGGTAPYTYLWSDGFTTKDRSALAEGSYILSVIDANQCQATAAVIINTFKFYLSQNPVVLSLQALDIEAKPNLSFLADVYIEDTYKSFLYTKKFSSEHPSRVDGSTDFDFREVLNAYMEPLLPDYGSSSIVREDGSFKRFYIEHTEKFGEPPIPGSFTQIDTYFVLLGGISEQEHAKYVFFDSYLESQKPFLTWQPVNKEVLPLQHEYLSYVVFDNLTNELNLKVFIKYTDGSEAEALLFADINAASYEVYRIPAGYTQLNIEAKNPEKTVQYYTLWLEDQNGAAISEERTYTLVEEETHYRTFIYLNSLGRWDTILAKGRGSSKLRTSNEVIDRELPVGYKYSDREQVVTNKTGQHNNDVVIGNLTNDERGYLVDLAISTQVYEVKESGYLPVQVKMNFNPYDDLNELDEVGFDVMPPITRKYTPELRASAPPPLVQPPPPDPEPDPDPEVLSPPTTFLLIFDSNDDVRDVSMSWVNADTYDNLEIEAQVNGAAYAAVETIAGNLTSYAHNFHYDLGDTVRYRIRATTALLESVWVYTTQFTLPEVKPSIPSNLVLAFSSGAYQVTWDDNADNEDSYQLEKSTNGGFTYFSPINLPANTTSYEDVIVSAPGTQIRYRLAAVNETGYLSKVLSNILETP